MSFPHVFEPLRLRHKTLRSRITFGAHTANMAEDGLPGERHIGYYRERALGGAGMIVVEPVPVHRTAVLTRGNFRHDDDAIIPAFRRLTDACREANPDVVMIHQLYHVGQHGDADNSFAPNWSPSGLPSYHDADGSHAMTDGRDRGARSRGSWPRPARAQASGFDGIEIFAAYHALVDQFWTPWSNRRTDEWGGSFENRMRFSAEILRRIRERCGEDFIVGLAVSADPGSEAFPSIEELAEIVAWHDERRLMDYVTCGTGSYFDFDTIIPTSLFDAAARRAVRGGAQGASSGTRWSRPRATSGRPPRPRRSWPPAMPTWSASSAARSPTRTWSPRPVPGAPTRSGRASRATSCAGAAGRATTGSRASSTRRRGASGSGAATGSSRPASRGGSWSSVAGRPGWRRLGSRRSAATA